VSEFRTVPGFEEVWRPVGGRRVRPQAVLRSSAAEDRARLVRIVRRAPEVMVKITGRIRTAGHLKAHLDYISRRGHLEAEGRDGAPLNRPDMGEMADDWIALEAMDRRRRSTSPVSLSVVLSMPSGTDPLALRDAARGFAAAVFGGRRDYVFVLHTDADHPHVHLAVQMHGDDGTRLNPRKGDLQAWREAFAQALRDRGIEAEATPRRTRGVTRKPERQALRRLSDRFRAGSGAPPSTLRSAYLEAAQAAAGTDIGRRPWEAQLAARQARIRGLYRAQARLLRSTGDLRDAALAEAVERFVAGMPAPDTRRLALARELRDARGPDRDPAGNTRDRAR
jgi:hypothetical protein